MYGLRRTAALKESIKYKGQQCRLSQKDGGHAVFEVPMLCLVAEMPHAHGAAQGSPQERRQKQRSLRDAPGAPDGSLLVYSHDRIAYNIDDGQIDDNKSHKYCSPCSCIFIARTLQDNPNRLMKPSAS